MSSLVTAVLEVLASAAAARGLSVIKGLVVAALISPAEYGVSTLIAVVVAYVQFSDLGAGTAASRQLSSSVGRRDFTGALAAARQLLGLRLVGAIIAAGVAIAFSLTQVAEPLVQLGLRLSLPIALATAAVGAVLLRQQAEGRARDLARTSFAQALLDTTLAVGLTSAYGFIGLLLALLLSPMLLCCWLAWRGALMRPRLPTRPTFSTYLKIGVPWVALGLLEHNLVYVDHFLMVGLFGVRSLGIYNIGMLTAEFVRMLGLVVGVTVGPRLVQKYAAHADAVESIREITMLPVHCLAAFLPFAVSSLYFVSTAVLRAFYPEYSEAASVIAVLLLAGYFLAVHNGITYFFLAVGRQGRAALIVAAAVGLKVVLALVLASHWSNITAVAWASLVTYPLFLFANLVYVASHFRLTTGAVLSFIAGAIVPGLWLAATITAVDAWLGSSPPLSRVLLAIGLTWCLLSPLASWGLRQLRRLEKAV